MGGWEEGFVLGLNGYSSLIDGLFRARRFGEARRLYDEMLEENVMPDCVLYTIMIRGHSEVGRVEEALAFLREMTGRGIVPDTYCYNTLIKGLCDAGHLDEARSLRLEISQHDLFPDSATYTIMICGLCKEGLVLEARQIFDEMGKLGCDPSVHTFNALISGLCKAGKLEEAHSIFNKMNIKPSLFLRLSQNVDRVKDPGHLRKLVEELCEAGLVVKAYKLLRDVMGVVPDVFTYNILMNGFFKEGKPDEALRLFNELRIMNHNSPVDLVTLGTLIDGLSKANRENDAHMLYEQLILKAGRSPSSSICNTLMRTFCRKKRVAKAVSLWFTHITEWTTKAEDKETIELLKHHFEQGCIEEAVRGLIEMDQKNNSTNSFPYTIWLIGFCQARKVEEALKVFTILTEFDIELTPPSCVILIHSLCWEGELASALDVMLYALRKGFSLDQPVGNRLLKKLLMGNKKEEAHKLVVKMGLAGYDMDIYLRAETKKLLYNKVARVSSIPEVIKAPALPANFSSRKLKTLQSRRSFGGLFQGNTESRPACQSEQAFPWRGHL
ncbi:uncharacterized protein A4U43_C10F4910 [Asparagus officinalis]|uniref:Pentacotripeptide-repeat region of PRORP domain-containing protein n=1 Tax=Asparagus officinalis TaxID=4686 RepID=A0A5P1E409_ASPOF|nr:uncharacterized protein A4U43_C10F4910 [Asparagus officinalis]